MDTLVLIIGGNLGNRQQNMLEAQQKLIKVFGNPLIKSRVYETGAWGGKSSGNYLNQVLAFEVELNPQAILRSIQQIENDMGRTREVKWGDRIMDIDVLFLSDKVIKGANLQIPHPYIQDRRFVLKPLTDTLPDFIHPILNKSMKELLKDCLDDSKVQIYTEK